MREKQSLIPVLVDNGTSLVSWDNEALFESLDIILHLEEEQHKRNNAEIYVCQISKS